MREGPPRQSGRAWSRAGFLRAAVGGGAVVAGGAALGVRRRDAAPRADAAKSERDSDVLNVFLTLEYVQEAFYRQAVRSGRVDGPLLEFARAVAQQEAEHVAMLRERLGRRAEPRPKSDAGEAVSSSEAFRDAAVDLEEAILAVYIGLGPNLSEKSIVPVTTLVSVEARQAAWIRDLAGISPAPRAADPARKADAVLDDLRDKGLLA